MSSYISTAPLIVEFPDDPQYAMEGEGVMFQVGVTGVPHPKLTWYHDGVEVVPDYSRELGEDGTLSMPSAETKHGGVYQLVAHNPGGRAEREVRLTVAAEGESPPVSKRQPASLAPVLVTKLANHVERNHSRSNQGFSEEYQVKHSVVRFPCLSLCCTHSLTLSLCLSCLIN